VDNSPDIHPTELRGIKPWPMNDLNPIAETSANGARQAWVEDVTDGVEMDTTLPDFTAGAGNVDLNSLFGDFLMLPASWPPNLPSPCKSSPRLAGLS
jgi:hypothetical protein